MRKEKFTKEFPRIMDDIHFLQRFSNKIPWSNANKIQPLLVMIGEIIDDYGFNVDFSQRSLSDIDKKYSLFATMLTREKKLGRSY